MASPPIAGPNWKEWRATNLVASDLPVRDLPVGTLIDGSPQTGGEGEKFLTSLSSLMLMEKETWKVL